MIRDRIKELRRVRAGDLSPCPRNWRTHPPAQVAAMQGVLAEIGYADALLARELPDGSLELVDGHLRKELDPDQVVPVLVLDLTEAEAKKLLTVLDPLAAMAEANEQALGELLAEIQTESEGLQAMLEGLAAEAGVFNIDGTDAPTLPSGDRAPFRQMTFTVHDSQFETIEAALAKAKGQGGGVSDVNENSNGNALAMIAEAFVDG